MENIKKLEAEIEERKARIKTLKELDSMGNDEVEALMLSKQEEIDKKIVEYNSFQSGVSTARIDLLKLREELSILNKKTK